jgi:protein SCO1/2
MRNHLYRTALILMLTFGTVVAFAVPRNRYGANYWPNVTLINQDGKPMKFYDDLIKGKIVVIDFFYTQCKDACPLETARLRQVQKKLADRVGKDIFFISISLDTKHDTPEVLHDYAEMYNAGPGWYFLTGKEEDITLLSKRLGLYSPDWGRDGHTPGLMIGNEPTGQWMRQAATDNPQFLAIEIGEMLDSYKTSNLDSAASYKQVPRLKLTKGQYVFASQCSACHSVGHGDKIGPDLMGVTNVRSEKWLQQFIAEPEKFLDGNDPVATALLKKYRVRMPNLRLAPQDVNSIIEFLKTQSGDHTRTQAAQSTSRPLP